LRWTSTTSVGARNLCFDANACIDAFRPSIAEVPRRSQPRSTLGDGC
jgi:hypothetical protein